MNSKNKKGSIFLKIQLVWFLAALLISSAIYVTTLDKSGSFKAVGNMIVKNINTIDIFMVPLIFVVFAIFGSVTYLFIYSGLKQKEIKPAEPKEKMSSKKEKELKDRRMYLNLLSLLQKEGRLLDFFAEDLSQYEDEQIGAAVRGVHENCSKIVKKYIDTEPVLEETEGDEVTIEAEFDPDTIKLTGNVTGKPPFNGVVVHRGWQAKKADLPRLSENVNSKLIVPAEVEIK